jgi:hypothetical protein
MASAAFKAVSEMPLFGNRAAACSCSKDMLTKTLHVVPSAYLAVQLKAGERAHGGEALGELSRTPSFTSSRRTASLRLEAETPLTRAASRNPPACATERSFRSVAIVQCSAGILEAEHSRLAQSD